MKTLADSRVLIVGLGLIGGSIARGLRQARPEQPVVAVDQNIEALADARRDGIIDGFGELPSLCAQADLVILALPPTKTAEVLEQIAGATAPETVVTDVASVKSHLLQRLDTLGSGFSGRFVPGHPIAGSERSGYEAASADLFRNRNVILTPLADTRAECVNLVHELWRTLGAKVSGMSVSRHDQLLAATSHLPHLLAFAVVDVLARGAGGDDMFRCAGGGFADFSRPASSAPELWADIFLTNAAPLDAVLADYIQRLRALGDIVRRGDRDELAGMLGRAKSARDRFVASHSGSVPAFPAAASANTLSVAAGGRVRGSLRVPGDKSISHRAVILGAIADGVTTVRGFLEGDDTLATLAAFREMGVTICGPEDGELRIYGVGMHGLKAPRGTLEVGNSGTAMRLLAGLLAAQPFASELDGDASLRRRPMQRIARPLQAMGARLQTGADGTPPLRIDGGPLQGRAHTLEIASAQVKSCLLLAGLYGKGETRVREPAPCRDHLERMLTAFACPLTHDKDRREVAVEGGHRLRATTIEVPADVSSAAFFMVAAAIAPDSYLCLQEVGVNPTRTGIIDLLRAMGANIELRNERMAGGEPVADLHVRHGPLHGIEVPQQQVPLAIDEFPALFVAAACAEGVTELRGAAELRVKESDRIEVMAAGLRTLGTELETFADGIRIKGGRLGGGEVDCHADHRVAMAFAVAALRASAPIHVHNSANVATSFPGFTRLARSVGLKISEGEQRDPDG